MRQYLDLLQMVLDKGQRVPDRTGTGTLSIFGTQTRYDLQEGFPLVTTKKVHVKSIFEELIWFLNGDTNNKYLQSKGVSIWNEWANPDGSLGKIYGSQWRSWGGRGLDQIQQVIQSLTNNPSGRRHIVSAWNVSDLKEMALPPCHLLFQFYVREGMFLDCQLYQRSADLFLGVPFNIASYALLIHLIAHVTGYEVGEFIHTIGDAHIYTNHIEQVKLQLSREPLPLPKLTLEGIIPENLRGLKLENFSVHNYESHPAIKGAVSV